MKPSSGYSFFSGAKPRIIGHRGAAAEAPENTLLSFEKALEDGAGYVELDVRLSKDAEIVIHHDLTLDRTTDGHGRIDKHSLQELKSLNAGYRFKAERGAGYSFRDRHLQIPTLEEFFAAFPGTNAIIELKPDRPFLVQRVIETIRNFNRTEQVILATERDDMMDRIRHALRQANLSIATGFSYGEVAEFMRRLGGDGTENYFPYGQAFQIPAQYGGMTLVSAQSVDTAHHLGLEIFVWTVNDVDEMKRLLALGVDGIITDYPARMRDLVSQSGP